MGGARSGKLPGGTDRAIINAAPFPSVAAETSSNSWSNMCGTGSSEKCEAEYAFKDNNDNNNNNCSSGVVGYDIEQVQMVNYLNTSGWEVVGLATAQFADGLGSPLGGGSSLTTHQPQGQVYGLHSGDGPFTSAFRKALAGVQPFGLRHVRRLLLRRQCPPLAWGRGEGSVGNGKRGENKKELKKMSNVVYRGKKQKRQKKNRNKRRNKAK